MQFIVILLVDCAQDVDEKNDWGLYSLERQDCSDEADDLIADSHQIDESEQGLMQVQTQIPALQRIISEMGDGKWIRIEHVKFKTIWHVFISKKTEVFCTCLRPISFGYACEHIARALALQNVHDSYEMIFSTRWRMDSLHPDIRIYHGKINEEEVLRSNPETRSKNIVQAFKPLLEWGKVNAVRQSILEGKIKQIVEELLVSNNSASSKIDNPISSRKSGRIERVRNCKKCKLPGHNSRSCPTKNSASPANN